MPRPFWFCQFFCQLEQMGGEPHVASDRILKHEADSDAVRPVRSTVLKEIQLDLQVWGCWGHHGATDFLHLYVHVHVHSRQYAYIGSCLLCLAMSYITFNYAKHVHCTYTVYLHLLKLKAACVRKCVSTRLRANTHRKRERESVCTQESLFRF